LHKSLKILGLTALFCMAFVGQSFAAADTDTVTAITSSTTTLKDTIEAALPLILGVTAVMVVVSLAKRLLRKAG
jgi:hypothetical protein